MPTHPYLQQLLTQAKETTQQVEALKTYTPEQLAWKPSAESWSMLECIEHLVKTSDFYLPRLKETYTNAQANTTPHAFRPSLFARLFFHFVSPKGRIKVKTLRMVTPQSADTDPAMLDHFIAQQSTLYECLEEADGLDLNKTKFASPLNSRVRFTIGEGLTVVVQHQQRHLLQAQRLAQQEAFPK